MKRSAATAPAVATDPAAATTTEVVLPGLVEPDGLQLRTRALPPPGAGQVRVAVAATGVSFAEQSMRRGRYPGQPPFPFVPGYDLVGTVERAGDGVDPALVGQRVAALTKTGGWATRALLDARDLVPVPAGVDAAEAEALVVNGLTAWQVLHRTARLRPGASLLVLGANGGVGTVLAQLARRHGVRVIGTARARHHDALRALGVEPVGHADPADPSALVAAVRALAPGGVDAVVDNLGGPHLRTSWSLLAPGGVLVSTSIASATTGNLYGHFARHLARLALWSALPNGRRAVFYDVWAGSLVRPAAARARRRADLAAVLDLLARGQLSVPVAARVPLEQAARALALAEERAAVGKVVLVP